MKATSFFFVNLVVAAFLVLLIYCSGPEDIRPAFTDVTTSEDFQINHAPRGLCDEIEYPWLHGVNRSYTNVTRGQVYYWPDGEYIGDFWDPVNGELIEDGWRIIATHQGQDLDNVCPGFFWDGESLQIDGGGIFGYTGEFPGSWPFRFVIDTGIPPNTHENIAIIVTKVDSI